MKNLRTWIALAVAVLLIPAGGSAGPLAPRIDSVDPAEVLVGSPELTVVVSGGGFRHRRLGIARVESRVVVDGQFVDSLVVSSQRIDAKIPARFFEDAGSLYLQVVNGVGRNQTFVPLTGSNAAVIRVVAPERIPTAIAFEVEPRVDVGCFSIEFFPVDASGDRLSTNGMSFTISSDDVDTPAADDGGAVFWNSYCDEGEPIAGEFGTDGSGSGYLWVRVLDPRTIRITARATEPPITGTSDPIRVAGGYISGLVTRANDAAPVPGVAVYLAYPGGEFGSEPVPFQWRDGSSTFVACGIRTGIPWGVSVGFGGLSSEPVGTTAADGTFTTRVVAARGWALYFRPPDASFLAAQWSGGAVDPAEAITLEVPDGETLGGADANLLPGGRIAGRVTDAATGEPLNDVGVDVVRPAGTRIGHVHTGEDGRFVTAGIPGGTYAVRLRPYDRNHLETWYGGASSIQDATVVDVAAGSETSGIDWGLVEGAVLTGIVGGGGSATPITAEVTLYDVDGATPRASGFTNAGGIFRTSPGAPAGSYRVRVRTLDATHPSGWWEGATSFSAATTLTLAESEEKTTVVSMPVGGVFTGQMMSAGLVPAPVSPGYVEVYDASTRALVGRGCTDGTGHYTTNGLAKGRYKLRFIPRLNDLAPEWFPDRSSFAEAEAVSIDYGDVQVADAAVQRGGTFAGKITNADGTPAPHAPVVPVADESDPRSFLSIDHYASTDENGRFEIRGLAPGAYTLVTYGGYMDDKPTTWYPGTPSRSTAGRVTAGSAELRSGLDFSFGRASYITGHVAGIQNQLYGYVAFLDPAGGAELGYALTDRLGDFRSGALHAGSYVVRFQAWNRAPAFYGGAFSREGATLVPVDEGATVASVDATLSTGRRVSGTVTAAHSGRFPAGIMVGILDRANGDVTSWSVTLNDGAFTSGMLGPGTYTILFEARDYVFSPQWFSGKSSFESADTIVVGSEEDVGGNDAVLELTP